MIYLRLFLNFLKIGLFTIGGGYAMIPMIGNTVISKGWISEELFIDFIAISESTPGPFAINIATFVGNSVGGIWGGIAAIAGLFIPSFVIIYIIFHFSQKFMENRYVKDVFVALRPTIVAFILNAFISIALATFLITDGVGGNKTFNWFGVVWSVICFLALRYIKKLHPVFMIIISAGVGILVYGVIGV